MKFITGDIDTLAKRFGFVALYGFGSRALEAKRCVEEGLPLDRANPADLDLGVQYRRDLRPSIEDTIRLTLALEEAAGTRVDLVDAGAADHNLSLAIIRGELLYRNDPGEQAEFELYVLRRAGDLAPFERERRRMLLEVR
ncbi:MAG: hypothetical protein MUC76_14635 [Spirochaetes bacterium]|jgi:predicted nucleotidyltransferase|nr:hypothetical protein [Spirochaetota bacterium]